MIKKFDISQSRNGEFLSTLSNVKDYLAQEDVADLGLSAVKTEFDKAIDDFTKTFKSYERGSKHTETLMQLDKERDGALRGFIKHANLFAHFPETDKAEAGKILSTLLKKYGKSPHTKPLAEETGIIIALLSEISSAEMKQKIALIGATPWIEVLTRSNTAFAERSKEKISETSHIEIGATKTARAKAYEVFKKLVKSINALAFVNGEEKYKRLADKINEEMAKIK